MSVRFLVLALVAVSLGACSNASLNDAQFATGSLGADEASAPQSSAPEASGMVSDPAVRQQLRAAAERAAQANDASATAYRVGPQDVIDVTVFKVPDLTKTVQVSEAGTINYPLIGETPVSGKTTRDIEQDLAKRLGAKYLQNPQVSVRVKENNSQRVTLEGAVKKPGLYPLEGGMTLLQLLATAGGTDDKIAEDDAVILREVNGRRKAARFSISELRTESGKDPRLQSGDIVIVHQSGAKQAYNTFMKALPVASFFLLF